MSGSGSTDFAAVQPSPRLRQVGAAALKDGKQDIGFVGRKDFQREHWFSPHSTLETSYGASNYGAAEALASATPSPRRQHQEAGGNSFDTTGMSDSMLRTLNTTRGGRLAGLMLGGELLRSASTYQDAYPDSETFKREFFGAETMYNARKNELIEVARVQARFGHIMRGRSG